MKIYHTRRLHAAGILPKPAPTQDVARLAERLAALRLPFAAESLEDLVSLSVKDDSGPLAFLDSLVRLELERQEERRVTQAIRISHLPTGPTVSNFDFAFQPSVSRSQIQTLSSGQWIRDGHGLLLQGPPGVGKTHLAVALGMSAIESGFSVSFYRLDELMHQLKRDAELDPTKLKHRKYMAANLVIIDEFGYQCHSQGNSKPKNFSQRAVGNQNRLSGNQRSSKEMEHAHPSLEHGSSAVRHQVRRSFSYELTQS